MKTSESFKIPNYSGCGVYAIINIIDFKAYVGSSRNIRKRAREHLHELKNKSHSSKELQKDFDKKLRFVVLKKLENGTDKSKLRIAEYSLMLKMLQQDFELYNTIPFSGVENRKEQLYFIIASETLHEYYGVAERAIKNEFGTYPWFIRRKTEKNKMKLLKQSEFVKKCVNEKISKAVEE